MNPALSAAPLEHASAQVRQGRNMPVQRKVFRIEQMSPVTTPAALLAAKPDPELLHDEILGELQALRHLMERRGPGSTEVGACSATASGLRRFKDEAGTVHDAIGRLKQQIAALHAGPFDGGTARATRELDAVAAGAERATLQIIKAAEDIDDAANTLTACLQSGQQKALAQDISDHVIRIFEACNFQDLSGQRISKVVETLNFIEHHIERMMDTWGDLAAFNDYRADASATRDRMANLHGPKLAGDPGHITQEEVDALFASD
jgi:chemotaxis protein CheZ